MVRGFAPGRFDRPAGSSPTCKIQNGDSHYCGDLSDDQVDRFCVELASGGVTAADLPTDHRGIGWHLFLDALGHSSTQALALAVRRSLRAARLRSGNTKEGKSFQVS